MHRATWRLFLSLVNLLCECQITISLVQNVNWMFDSKGIRRLAISSKQVSFILCIENLNHNTLPIVSPSHFQLLHKPCGIPMHSFSHELVWASYICVCGVERLTNNSLDGMHIIKTYARKPWLMHELWTYEIVYTWSYEQLLCRYDKISLTCGPHLMLYSHLCCISIMLFGDTHI